MAKGKIGVTSQDLFPIIKKFLYSNHDIFLREIIANAVDATQKLNTLASTGQYKGEIGDTTIEVKLDKEAKTLTISDKGIGMTKDEIKKYINQIAFSGAEEFLDKYKDKANAIIGHFGLGFYSSFMVSDQVEIQTLSYQEGAEPAHWTCDGTPEYTLKKGTKTERGTDIIMHISEDEKEFLEEPRIKELLNKYCKFLPIPIAFGKKKDWKDGKEIETDEVLIVNDTNPTWTKAPADLKQEDYDAFYHQLYPFAENPMFHIHLNVDYPFNLTGILYFPKIKNNMEIQKNKIQLYSNQVFVTDSVEDIVPEFLTLLHGVIDSPDIPLNVSRSYLQSDSNVRKISNHITKKVADSLHDLFKNDRASFEEKWNDLRIFVQYGMLTDEKFAERAKPFFLLENIEGKYFTLEEYENLVKENQTDKDNNVIFLYSQDKDAQYSYIQVAKDKGYDVLLMDGQLDTHFINFLEQKDSNKRYTRVDADVVNKLIVKDETTESSLTEQERTDLAPIFSAPLQSEKINYMVNFEALGENAQPVLITQAEFMRRMKDMSAMGGGGMNFYGEMPDSYTLIVNTDHELVKRIIKDKEEKLEGEITPFNEKIAKLEAEEKAIDESKDADEVKKDKREKLTEKLSSERKQKEELLSNFGKDNELVKQLTDLALLSNNMLKGEDLAAFVKRSVGMIK
ncbi:molecular chaperone HtpG [Balneicella halophila]|uniref:Chaperone protein HtpG n=1 Tax=Balneicella halophila TaxID=1537566 RepID=A0A7L4US51_BALHA|nr:molecular chaperone HtpG [Balneicella halophila]PVX52489.1 molecular chaperone HtpG [Balneicella halophila]